MKYLRLTSTVFFLTAFLFFPHIPGSAGGQIDAVVGSDLRSLAPVTASDSWFTVFGPPVKVTDTSDKKIGTHLIFSMA